MKIMDLSLKTKPVTNSCGHVNNPLSVHAIVKETGFAMRVNTLSSFVEANRLVCKTTAYCNTTIINVSL